MKIGIDIDGVVCDLMSLVCKRINMLYDTMYTPEDIREWHQPLDIPVTLEAAVRDTLINDEPPLPYPDAYCGVKALLQRGHSLVFITGRKDDALIKARTKLWCMYSMPEASEKVEIPIVHTTDKSEMPIDVLIEDNWDTAMDFAETGRKVIVPVRPWNESDVWRVHVLPAKYARIYAVRGWKKIVGVIDGIERENVMRGVSERL